MAQPNYPAGPSVFTTVATVTASSGSYVDIAADSTQIEIILSNYHATLSMYVRDQAATAQGGTLVAALTSGVFSTSAALRVVNPGGSDITVGINRVKTP